MSKSILQTSELCYKTGVSYGLDKHHVMNGNGLRDKSEKYGLWVYLHHDVHMWLHQTEAGQEYARELKAIAQDAFERLYGHDKWMEEFHKNYL